MSVGGHPAGPALMLVATGAAWGLTIPLLRTAVSTGYPPLGLLVWQQVITAAAMAVAITLMRRPWPDFRRHWPNFLAVAAFGALLPGYFAFLTADDLPAGVRAILIALVPMFTLPMALALGFERPDARRATGILLGALAVLLITLPGAGLTPVIGLGVILLALISPLSYGIEANYIAWRGAGGIGAVELLFGASVVGMVLAFPLAAAMGDLVMPGRVWTAADWAVLAAGLLNALAYVGYIWLVGRAGSVFASQLSYVVTATGVLWSMALLGERYSGLVWIAFGVMLAGIALVRPLRPAAKTA